MSLVDRFVLCSCDSILCRILQLNFPTPPASNATAVNFHPTKSNAQLNVLYFVGLVLALSVSSVCILIRESQRDIPATACDAIRLFQIRFDALQVWEVRQTLATLPVVLPVQVALSSIFLRPFDTALGCIQLHHGRGCLCDRGSDPLVDHC